MPGLIKSNNLHYDLINLYLIQQILAISIREIVIYGFPPIENYHIEHN